MARIAITFLYVVFATDPTMPKKSLPGGQEWGAVAVGIWLELVNRSTPRRSMSSSLFFTENWPIMKSLTLPALSLPMVVQSWEGSGPEPGYCHPAKEGKKRE